MIVFEKNGISSIDRVAHTPHDMAEEVLCFDKLPDRLYVELDKDPLTLGGLKGYIIRENDENGKVVKSAVGVGGSPLIVIGRDEAALYWNDELCGVVVESGCTLKFDLNLLMPWSYCSTAASVFLGRAPAKSYPAAGGVVEIYANDHSPVEADYLQLNNGRLCAMYGFTAGCNPPIMVPTTVKGSFLHMKARAMASRLVPERTDNGVCATTRLRTTIRSYLKNVAMGMDADANWCVEYHRKVSEAFSTSVIPVFLHAYGANVPEVDQDGNDYVKHYPVKAGVVVGRESITRLGFAMNGVGDGLVLLDFVQTSDPAFDKLYERYELYREGLLRQVSEKALKNAREVSRSVSTIFNALFGSAHVTYMTVKFGSRELTIPFEFPGFMLPEVEIRGEHYAEIYSQLAPFGAAVTIPETNDAIVADPQKIKERVQAIKDSIQETVRSRVESQLQAIFNEMDDTPFADNPNVEVPYYILFIKIMMNMGRLFELPDGSDSLTRSKLWSWGWFDRVSNLSVKCVKREAVTRNAEGLEVVDPRAWDLHPVLYMDCGVFEHVHVDDSDSAVVGATLALLGPRASYVGEGSGRGESRWNIMPYVRPLLNPCWGPRYKGNPYYKAVSHGRYKISLDKVRFSVDFSEDAEGFIKKIEAVVERLNSNINRESALWLASELAKMNITTGYRSFSRIGSVICHPVVGAMIGDFSLDDDAVSALQELRGSGALGNYEGTVEAREGLDAAIELLMQFAYNGDKAWHRSDTHGTLGSLKTDLIGGYLCM